MSKSVSVQQFMSKDVVSVTQETPLLEAVDLMLKKNFNGLPVINKSGKLLGIITEYDMMIRGSAIHLPTFLKLLQKFDVYSKDEKFLGNDVKNILSMRVADVMSKTPFFMRDNATLTQAVKVFRQPDAQNPIPIIDKRKKLVGILARYDVIKLMGAPPIASFKYHSENRKLDRNINKFLADFEKQFLFVSRFRTVHWLLISILFAIVGFLVAFMFILRFV
jgi:CBS domain-containing protein